MAKKDKKKLDLKNLDLKNIDVKQAGKKILPILKRVQFAIISVVFVVAAGYSISQTQEAQNTGLDDEYLQNKLVDLKFKYRTEFDRETIEEIRTLFSLPINVDPDLPSNRENPF